MGKITTTKPLNQNKMTGKINEFLEKLDILCFEYQIQIKPTYPVPNDEYPTISVINNDEVVKLLYVDGDGMSRLTFKSE